ncbi:hypothetical protein J5J86_20585 [Aquabacter sp. L1I39]|uniref:hypothetical protein n=1 Tax=Aquabacter sp. L1I39 TaxID=2820278 RepID=UPI001ADCFF96|nr:hypothetical protein [Aquabacter sp. L1I39]QTL03126.1 hypothetical protein J5J86_20585 [Aquabacter sp. L1I39]
MSHTSKTPLAAAPARSNTAPSNTAGRRADACLFQDWQGRCQGVSRPSSERYLAAQLAPRPPA